MPTTGPSVFFVTSKHYGQSFAFPHKSKLGNALLHSRSGYLQIQTLFSAALLPVILNTIYDKFINTVVHIRASIYNGPNAEKG